MFEGIAITGPDYIQTVDWNVTDRRARIMSKHDQSSYILYTYDSNNTPSGGLFHGWGWTYERVCLAANIWVVRGELIPKEES